MDDNKIIQLSERQEVNSCEDEDNFLNLVAEIIVEIILKEEKDERNRVRSDQQERPV